MALRRGGFGAGLPRSATPQVGRCARISRRRAKERRQLLATLPRLGSALRARTAPCRRLSLLFPGGKRRCGHARCASSLLRRESWSAQRLPGGSGLRNGGAPRSASEVSPIETGTRGARSAPRARGSPRRAPFRGGSLTSCSSLPGAGLGARWAPHLPPGAGAGWRREAARLGPQAAPGWPRSARPERLSVPLSCGRRSAR